MFDSLRRKSMDLPTREQALPDRPNAIAVPDRHYVLGTPLAPPFPAGLESIEGEVLDRVQAAN